MSSEAELAAGARNLLVNCAGMKSDESLLIVKESSELGWYDDAAPEAAIACAHELGIKAEIMDVDGPQSRISTEITRAVEQHDCTVFFARIGDQDRFSEPPPGCRSVMVYARDTEALSSAYGRTDHRAMIEVKRCVNELLANAGQITITCPLGTQMTGKPAVNSAEELADVAVARFPLAVPAPVLAAGFSGRVALSHYMTTTGSMPYEPSSVPIDGVVFAKVANGHIDRFSGDPKAVSLIEQQYDHVASLFGIKKSVVHSWHPGIHPACFYPGNIADDPDRWSNNIFANPRLLHFHTCGDYAPGEICWMVLDPTIAIDGINLWDNGKLCLQQFDTATACFETWPVLRNLFDNPDTRIGL